MSSQSSSPGAPLVSWRLLSRSALVAPCLALASLGLSLVLPGCADVADVADVGPSISEINQQLEDCGFACGDNGAVIDGVYFWELNLAGGSNDHDVVYSRFARSEMALAANDTLLLDVDGARLRAYNAISAQWVEGSSLVGGVMEVMVTVEGQPVPQPYHVKILAVHSGATAGQPYWTKAQGLPQFVETYTFGWKKAPDTSGRYHLMCNMTSTPQEPWQHQLDALVFEGDRYDIKTKAVTSVPTASTTWFNIACAGSLPAKMHLTRRTAASSDAATFSSTISDDRQAMARMWAADYCGDGYSFTSTGHKLRIADRKTFSLQNDGWIPNAAPVGFSEADKLKLGFSYEALWDANGAVCLDTPRLVPRSEVEARCPGIPTCNAFLPAWKLHGQILSANPAEVITP